jgi:hypothetical protein
MKPSPPSHRNSHRDAGGRLDGRPRGDTHPRAGGRKPDISLSRLPAARVALRAPYSGYRVFSEDAYQAGVDLRPGPGELLVGAGRRGRGLQRIAGAAALSGALGAGVGAVAFAASRPQRIDRRDTTSRLSTARTYRGAGRVARVSMSPASSLVPTSSSPPARRRRLISGAPAREQARATTSSRAHPRSGLVAAGGSRPVAAPTMAGPSPSGAGAPHAAVWTVTPAGPGTGAVRIARPGTAQASEGDQQTAGARTLAPATADAQGEFGFEH